ncbi:MAG: hypothetical protein WDA16_13680, partial [Candidatus Thermoplasmatota archaeon]
MLVHRRTLALVALTFLLVQVLAMAQPVVAQTCGPTGTEPCPGSGPPPQDQQQQQQLTCPQDQHPENGACVPNQQQQQQQQLTCPQDQHPENGA